ncbi:MAG TPA: hypothetical protein VFG83_13595 [Kofleriaceae bacterium]|nr:hypothetical protein [Kofleriaceae bacterium]
MKRLSGARLVGAWGTNQVMAAELSRLCVRALGLRPPNPRTAGSGTLIYDTDEDTADKLARVAVTYHRTSSRVLRDLYESRATRLEALHADLSALCAADERPWLADGARISIRARNLGGFAAGPRQVVGAVKAAIIDGARARKKRVTVDADSPDVTLAVRLHDDALTVSVDVAGRSLASRGFRADGGEAPLRENLAAALVMLARFDARKDVLIDPMCGSGTIAIEAALMAAGAPLAGGNAAPPLFPGTHPTIIAGDNDPRQIGRARKAIAGAGLAVHTGADKPPAGAIHTIAGDFRALTPARVAGLAGSRALQSGVIIANLPYGERLPMADAYRLYSDVAAWARQFRGLRAAFLIANPRLARAFGTRPKLEKPLRNGGIPVWLYVFAW